MGEDATDGGLSCQNLCSLLGIHRDVQELGDTPRVAGLNSLLKGLLVGPSRKDLEIWLAFWLGRGCIMLRPKISGQLRKGVSKFTGKNMNLNVNLSDGVSEAKG